MKRLDSTNVPLRDYGQALKNAVNWLGDRYLLAEPVRKRNEEFKGYYSEPRRWQDEARRATGNQLAGAN